MGRLAICCALVVAAGSAVQAQIPVAPPSRPTGPVSEDPRDAGYPAWRDANLTLAATSQHIVAGRFEAVIRSPGASERARRLADLGPAIERCVERLELSEEQVATLTQRAPWAAFDALANGPYVSVTIVPTVADGIDCNQSPPEQEALRSEALRFGAGPIAPSANNVRAVEVWRGTREIAPVLIGQAPVLKVSSQPRAIAPDNSHAVRLYLRYDDLAPTTGVDTAGLEFRIWNGVDSIPWSLRVPRATVNVLWREIVAWRLERSRAVSPQGLPINLPAAGDPAYVPARASYASGDYVSSALSALAVLDRNILPPRDRLTATVQIGITLRALGDLPASSLMFADALALEPCLGFPVTVPEEFRELARQMQPVSRCNIKSLGEIVVLGLVPGRAQRSLQPARWVGGNAVTGFTIALGVASLATYVKAQSLHKSYHVDTEDPIGSYAVAERMRARSTQLGVATYALWGGAIVHAVLAERAHTRALDDVRFFGRSDQRAVHLAPAARGIGLALHFF